ncbi:MAG: hypothetical protein IKL73_00885 [Lachnospiraceae bacterium]|nr:hypothetical protein [Lachnospiraceae bacterium]
MKKKIIIAAVIACVLISSIATVKYFMREKVPEGCVYIENGGKRYEAGERMPLVAGYGDEFITEDYIYTVQYNWHEYYWKVKIKDNTKTNREPVLGYINDELEIR